MLQFHFGTFFLAVILFLCLKRAPVTQARTFCSSSPRDFPTQVPKSGLRSLFHTWGLALEVLPIPVILQKKQRLNPTPLPTTIQQSEFLERSQDQCSHGLWPLGKGLCKLGRSTNKGPWPVPSFPRRGLGSSQRRASRFPGITELTHTERSAHRSATSFHPQEPASLVGAKNSSA